MRYSNMQTIITADLWICSVTILLIRCKKWLKTKSEIHCNKNLNSRLNLVIKVYKSSIQLLS